MTKSLGQKVSYLFAVISLLVALAATVAAIVYEPGTEMDPIQASLMASAFFFGSCAVVLYVIGTARLKGDPSEDGDR